MIARAKYWTLEMLGYALCELAFKTGCRGPFTYAYRVGCWMYGQATDAGIRCGALILNPRYHPGNDEPFYIRR